ncbi:effector protein B, substrate of the Dot/Icm secretion system [Legionella moravica]|uniref:Effector protein B, substrate of the Dot/Icm secretion system n=2 Tax=Legionella moravica TaxID=39962 RepID=A0A378JUP5_9GAMM|nr:hypothetical protein [Legionella moravica]KTD32360.1 effector protein B, substrate of the Dot/Icm secretion system [Legionella moravica]STX62455.1 LepB protein [Legionella moravica]
MISWEKNERDGTYTSLSTSTSGSGSVEGFRDILGYLSVPFPADTQFVVYDVSCPNKEEHIKKLLTGINKLKQNDLLPTLISIGHEQSPLSEDISGQVSIIKEVPNTVINNELLKNIVQKELINNKKEIEFPLKLEKKQKEFDTQLSIISKKATKLRNYGHITAADKADQLYTNLTKLSQTYFPNPTEEAYVTFKNQTKDKIKNAHKILDKHRGWNRVLGNIGLAILGFGILYLAAVVINRNVFFNKTDSTEKLDNLEKLIDNNAYQMK